MFSLMGVHAEDLVRKAERNVAKWGDQDYETLTLAVAEEAGELAQAVLQHKWEAGDESRIPEEAADLGALCLQVMRLYDRARAEEAKP